MSKFTLRSADPETDFEFARSLHHRVYRDVVTRQFGEWDESLQDRFFEEGWKRTPNEIIQLEGKPIGVLSSEKRTDHIYLNELQISPEFQGRGIGSEIVKTKLTQSKELGVPVRLQVLRENKAVNLYRRLGFSEAQRTDTHVFLEWTSKRGAAVS